MKGRGGVVVGVGGSCSYRVGVGVGVWVGGCLLSTLVVEGEEFDPPRVPRWMIVLGLAEVRLPSLKCVVEYQFRTGGHKQGGVRAISRMAEYWLAKKKVL
jgi:hypothetical protein